MSCMPVMAVIASDRSEAMKHLRDAPSLRPGPASASDEAWHDALFALTNDFASCMARSPIS